MIFDEGKGNLETLQEGKWSDLSLDIETLDTKSTAVVMSIGAVFFAPGDGQNAEHGDCVYGPEVHIYVDAQSQIANNRTMSNDTLRWWFDQVAEGASPPMATHAFNDHALPTAIEQLFSFICDHSAMRDDGTAIEYLTRVWTRGPHFDWAIIESCARMCGIASPVNYSRVRDQRTYCAGFDWSGNVPHDALQDAKIQANRICHVADKRGEVLA